MRKMPFVDAQILQISKPEKKCALKSKYVFVCLPISVQIKSHFNSNLISLYNKRMERGIFFCHYVQLFQFVK